MSPPRKALLISFAVLFGAAGVGCKNSWGLQSVETLKTPADGALACGAILDEDAVAADRDQCKFEAGDHASQTLAVGPAMIAAVPVRHLVVLMRENRSFDHLLGKIHERGQPDAEAVPASYTNPDAKGALVSPTHATTTCISHDPGHQFQSMNQGINGGKMDGWVQNAASTTGTDGRFALDYYDETDLPFYYWVAKTFALSDRHFAPMASGTFANRSFFLLGTNAGVINTGIAFPPPSTPSVLELLINAGYTWGMYTDGNPFSSALGWKSTDPGVHPLKGLFDAMDGGELPNVAFVDGIEDVNDDHPTADLQRGEQWMKAIYDHAVTSPQWDRMAMIWTYDEGGGFADHVAPQQHGCRADPFSPFTLRGPRIPLAVISPWAKRNFVSHRVTDHTAITRLIETLFDLPALTARDANSEALLDMFDFSCGRDLAVAPAPAAGTGGCPTGPTATAPAG